ncbi:GNAT family N-acetyltransferase [Taibaiella helva]|uniref:GNAT family N-acetyltransferase n=1 Tax=Taibaiella helva TaxID=2301235 RepID=UPI000E5978FB|nr:GNAT family N-acetyltransferase [Taibaiella helva]
MITYLRVNAEHAGFRELVHELDAFLAVINGTGNDFFSRLNHIEPLKQVVVACEGGRAIGCGAIKAYDEETMEVKRMFVRPGKRGQGIAAGVLEELERWSLELGYGRCILETAGALTDAIRLYTRNHYRAIPNYGPYEDVATSVCFEKRLV